MGLVLKYYQVTVPGLGPADKGWPDNPNANLLSATEKATKVSISAPPGTEVILNNRTIVIGLSGIYDLTNDDVEITTIRFPEQLTYTEGLVDTARLNAVKEKLRNVRTLNTPTNFNSLASTNLSENSSIDDYIAFCSTILSLYEDDSFSYTANNQTYSVKGLIDLINEFDIVRLKQISSTPTQLHDLIVNYVSNTTT